MTAPGKQVAAEGKLHSKGSDDCLVWPLGVSWSSYYYNDQGQWTVISFDPEIMAAASPQPETKFSFSKKKNEISHLTSRQEAIDGTKQRGAVKCVDLHPR
jgi:hypothetical protein